MAEYIDREIAVKGLRMAHDADGAEFVRLIPAADVAPIVHAHKVTHNRPISGHWVSGESANGEVADIWIKSIMDNPVDYCSACGRRLDDTFQHYCPNCGAKMDERGEDDV